MPIEDLSTGKTAVNRWWDDAGKNKSECPLLEHEFVLLRDFIYQHFGIYFTDDKKWMLESKLAKLMSYHALNSFLEYYQFLMRKFYVNHDYADPDFIELIRAVTNHETYFLREQEAFKMIHILMENDLRVRSAGNWIKNYRLLSAGCSTGEEVYSVVMWLTENGFRTQNFSVLGIDIDPTVLETAHCGVYRPFSFRGFDDSKPMGVWEKYFSKVPSSGQRRNERGCDYIVQDGIRENVDFRQINILDLTALKKQGPFDVILCRNVLIYFNDESKQMAIDNFAEALNPGGYLFLGHSESIISISGAFEVVNDQPIIFYRKKNSV